MNDLTLGSITLSSIDTAFCSTSLDGSYYTLPPYGLVPYALEPNYEDIFISFPFVDGFSRKRMGKRSQRIVVSMVTINATPETVETTRQAIMTEFTDLARKTITLPDNSSYLGCILRPGQVTVQDNFSIADTTGSPPVTVGKWCCLWTAIFEDIGL